MPTSPAIELEANTLWIVFGKCCLDISQGIVVNLVNKVRVEPCRWNLELCVDHPCTHQEPWLVDHGDWLQVQEDLG